MAISDIDPSDRKLMNQARSAAAAKAAPLPVQDSADVVAAKKLAADIAAQTGQKVDPTTGQIVVDPAAIAAKFPTSSGGSIPAINNRNQEPGTARSGYKWQWVSMAKGNNPYGGEWREIPTGAAGGGGGNVTTPVTPLKSDAQIAADAASAARQGERQSAYDLLYSQFKQYGLETLVEPLKELITSGASPAEFTIKLRESKPYQQRFAGNAKRIANGLAAVDESTYLKLEDQYQNIMRNYGLPATYWKPGDLGTQDSFTNLIANDVSATELESRISTAQKRVINANPEIAYTLKQFYPEITNGDILAYALDPKNALDAINRKVTAAEIGGAALAQGLTTSLGGAEDLASYGVTKDQAQKGYQSVAGVLPRGSQLADIYGEQPYTQQTAEAEIFGTAGSAEAKKRREKLVSLEQAAFGGSSGVSALGRDKAIYGGASGQSGLY